MMFWESTDVRCDRIQDKVIADSGIELFMARFDEVHPVISGNKLFKLHYFLTTALLENKPVVTFGGPYSNHLAATAYACKVLGLECTGIINGEQPLTHTLKQCKADGMSLKFVSRETYREIKTGETNDLFPGSLVIPEGGFHPLGVKGAALMPQKIDTLPVTHICLAVGTATTLAGFLIGCEANIIAVPAIKNMTDIPARLSFLEIPETARKPEIWNDYHFGGFAKMQPALLDFIKGFKGQHGIELDRVYTAKMMWGVMEKIKLKHFAEGSKIVCIHTGGLQGNEGLEIDRPGTTIQ